MSIIVTGHMKPDADAVISSIAVTELMNKRGFDCIAAMQGPVNPETDFILNKFNLAKPQIITSLAGRDVILVDTTDTVQLPSDLSKANNIVAIVDHHKLGAVTTSAPVEMWVWPVGCTCTIIEQMYKFYNIEIPSDIAGGMLSAIISDTVLFKSPTTTQADRLAVERLAKIAGVTDIQDFGMQILRKKSDIENISALDLLSRDLKNFTFAGKSFAIGQVEVIDLSMLDTKRDQLINEMKKLKASNNYDTIILMLTDIMKEGTDLLIVSDQLQNIEKAFDKKSDNGSSIWLDKVISRKKQIIPPLEEFFK